MLEVVVPPLAATYVVFVAIVIALRRPISRPSDRADCVERCRRTRLGHVVGTTIGGYVAFLAIVLVFHVWLAREHDAFWSAVWGGGFLSLVTLAVSVFVSSIGRRWLRRG